jgi:hypothetical protein
VDCSQQSKSSPGDWTTPNWVGVGTLPTTRRCFDSQQDRGQHSVNIAHDVLVGHMQNAETEPPQRCVAATISLDIMRFAIDFNDQSLLRAHKIGNEWSDICLPAKFVTLKLRVAQLLP